MSEPVRAALEKWAGFPVDREPRPIVLTGQSPQEADRLAADPRWRAVFDGPAVPESELPPELLPAARHYCRDVRTGRRRPLARIVRADGPFATDRGLRELPAWMMFPADRRWPFIALDPEFERRMTWSPGETNPGEHEECLLGADGRTLTYRFMGTPRAYADYPRAEVHETRTAVCVDPVEVATDPPDGIRLAYAEVREVVVRLAAPLGPRLLVSARTGAARTVVPAPR